MASDRVVVDASFILESILPTTAGSRADANALINGLASRPDPNASWHGQ